MCSFGSCQTRFEFLSQFRKVRNAFECFVTQVQTRLPKTKCVWPMKINVICTVRRTTDITQCYIHVNGYYTRLHKGQSHIHSFIRTADSCLIDFLPDWFLTGPAIPGSGFPPVRGLPDYESSASQGGSR